jgi:hypothetical protein
MDEHRVALIMSRLLIGGAVLLLVLKRSVFNPPELVSALLFLALAIIANANLYLNKGPKEK